MNAAVAVLLSMLLPSATTQDASAAANRPHIVGLSHIALYCHDLDKTRAFYKDFLG